MEPISLSLMAISACSVAIRRIDAAKRAERDAAPDHGSRTLIMEAISRMTVQRATTAGGTAGLRAFLEADAERHGVVIVNDLSLNDCFEVSGANSVLLQRALGSRTVDVMLCDPDGMPLCGLDLPASDADHQPDPIRIRVFREAGLPLVVLPGDCTWHGALERLGHAFDGTAAEAPEEADMDAELPGDMRRSQPA